MAKRILTAVIGVPLLAVVLLVLPKIYAALAYAVLCACAAYEICKATGVKQYTRLMAYTVLFAAAVPLWSYFGSSGLLAQIALLGYFVLMFAEIMLSKLTLPFAKACIAFFAAFPVPYMLSATVRLLLPELGRILVCIPFVIGFLSDSGAFFVGRAIGKHKMSPLISPKKSVEGLFGGIVASILGMLAFALIVDKATDATANYALAFVFGLLGALAGTFGDLSFSCIKREYGIKDYSQILPGHGGILDRFDSLIAIALMVEILMDVLPVVV
ncbi:MAG: phosphatidate cytidylyltransferase [Firmicutes bacterium]|nr:phosphatidate cytidylyltransferase [Bacillota bacterium]